MLRAICCLLLCALIAACGADDEPGEPSGAVTTPATATEPPEPSATDSPADEVTATAETDSESFMQTVTAAAAEEGDTLSTPTNEPAEPSPTQVPPEADETVESGRASTLVMIENAGAVPGETASVRVQTEPGKTCDLSYTTPAGNPSEAGGLGATTADADGVASWSWVIGGRTGEGEGHLTIRCGDESLTETITIG